MDVWVERYGKAVSSELVAVVGSPGMRSVGKLVVDQLVKETRAELIAELYSKHFPVIYETKPSFAAHPSLPGTGGVTVQSGSADLPKVQFYAGGFPPVVFARGYHANFAGQFDVAEKVVDLFTELHIRRMFVVAGYGSKEKKICCAATDQQIMDEMKEKFNIGADYKGPFYGFSGLVFGLAKLKGLEAICLFASAEPNPEDPELPAAESSKMILATLRQMLGFHLEPASL